MSPWGWSWGWCAYLFSTVLVLMGSAPHSAQPAGLGCRGMVLNGSRERESTGEAFLAPGLVAFSGTSLPRAPSVAVCAVLQTDTGLNVVRPCHDCSHLASLQLVGVPMEVSVVLIALASAWPCKQGQIHLRGRVRDRREVAEGGLPPHLLSTTGFWITWCLAVS